MVMAIRIARAFGCVRCLASVAVLLCTTAPAASAHPLHTSLADITYDPARRTMSVSLRLFVDDFTTAVLRGSSMVTQASAGLPPDSAMFRYIRQRFSIATTGAGARAVVVALHWCGAQRTGDVVIVCLRATGAGALRGARVTNVLMNEMFDDQVNMVQTSAGGKRQMLLFTRKSLEKRLN